MHNNGVTTIKIKDGSLNWTTTKTNDMDNNIIWLGTKYMGSNQFNSPE